MGCHQEFLGGNSYESNKQDVKPSPGYLLNYGSNSGASAQPEHHSSDSSGKSEYDPYYSKLNPNKQQDSPGSIKVPKSEVASSSCCGRPDLLVPKSETASSCRTTSPTGGMRPAYDPYLNQDSNSSSMSSMETMGSRSIHHMQHHPAAVMAAQHHNPHQPPPPPSTGSYLDDRQQHQMTSHRSPYHHQEDMYHRSYAEMAEASSNAGGIARPVVTYSTGSDMAGRAAYDSALVNTAGHRPYDPGTATAFERYDPTAAQACVQPPPQPPLMGQRGPAQLYSVYDEHHQEQRYQQEAAAAAAAAAQQQQQHQMAVANAAAAAAAAAGMMKAEHAGDQEGTGPLYPRYEISKLTTKKTLIVFRGSNYFNSGYLTINKTNNINIVNHTRI